MYLNSCCEKWWQNQTSTCPSIHQCYEDKIEPPIGWLTASLYDVQNIFAQPVFTVTNRSVLFCSVSSFVAISFDG